MIMCTIQQMFLFYFGILKSSCVPFTGKISAVLFLKSKMPHLYEEGIYEK